MAGFVYKSINAPSNAVKKYTLHKSWTVTDESQANYGIVSHSGQFSRGSFNIGDINDSNLANEPLSGTFYGRVIFDSIDHIYYTDPENATVSSDSQYFKQQTRANNRSVQLLSIPSNIFGQRLKEDSITLTSGNVSITDDGKGNLIDSSILSQTGFVTHSKDDYHIKINFDDGWRYQKGNYATDSRFKTVSNVNLRDESNGPFEPYGYNVTFEYVTDSIVSGSTALMLHGSQSKDPNSNSYVSVNRTSQLVSNTDSYLNDYAVELMVKIPTSQSVSQSYTGGYTATGLVRQLQSHETNTIISSGVEYQVPWELQVYNDSSTHGNGKLQFIRQIGNNSDTLFSISSSAAYNDNNWHHVVIQRSGSKYELWVDKVKQGSTVDEQFNENINGGDIYIGGRRFNEKSRILRQGLVNNGNNSQTVNYVAELNNQNIAYPFSGSVMQLKVFNKSLVSSEIASLKDYRRDTGIVGNVFYNHGFIVITDLSGSYSNIFSDYSLNFKGTTEHNIHNYRCIVEDGEFNMTFNPTARKNNDKNSPKLKGFATSSEFNPYITTIGLYNDENELLAVGKLAQPVRSPDDIDIVFNVQFDT